MTEIPMVVPMCLACLTPLVGATAQFVSPPNNIPNGLSGPGGHKTFTPAAAIGTGVDPDTSVGIAPLPAQGRSAPPVARSSPGTPPPRR